jgi:hypothetical protein
MPLAQHAPAVNPFAGMSPAVLALLRDEANLTTARHVLDDARQDCLTQLETVQAQRPAFGFLALKKQREEYVATVTNIEGQLAAIDRMIARVTAARERVQPTLRAALVDFLNNVDPMYRQGFRASRFHERWRRGHAVVCDRLRAFLRDTRELRNALAVDVRGARVRATSDTLWHLTNARKAAVELDREILSLNQVTQDHRSFVAGTPFAEIRLPTLESWACTDRIDAITVRAPADALPEADRLITEFIELREPTLTTILGIFESAAAEHNQLAEARLRQCWSTLLAHAEAHLVSDAELEPTLLDIERRLAEAERLRVSAQFVRPFDAER